MKNGVLRRLMMATALAGGFLFGSDDAFAQGREHKLPSQRKFTKAVRLSDTLDSVQRVEINRKFFTHAQEKGRELADAAETPYSTQLDLLEKELNAKLALNSKSLNKHTIFLDPVKADVLSAFNYNAIQVANYILLHHGFEKLPYGQPVKDVAKYYSGEKITPSQDPAAFINYREVTPGTVVMIPIASSLKEVNLRIAGMTHAENIEFINRHEGWHALCDRFSTVSIDTAETKKVDFLDNRAIAENDHATNLRTTKARREMLADIGAAGDMIRGGKSPDLIDLVITWRENPPEFTHLSTKGLIALKVHIDSVGLDQFRKMDHLAALELYHTIAQNEALTADGFKVLTLFLPSVADSVRKEWYDAPETNPDFKKMLSYFDYFNKLAEKREKVAFPSPDRQHAVWQLRDEKWDPLQELKDNAFKSEGRITPETLTRAYLRLLSGYERQIPAAGVESGLLVEKMEDLQIAYVMNLTAIDYVTANAAYGIKPRKTEKFTR